MGRSTVILFAIFTLVAITAWAVDTMIKTGFFEHIYNHRPEHCLKYSMNGSEDMALFPNNHVVISSGLFFRKMEGITEKPAPKMYVFDFNKPERGPVELKMDINRRDDGEFNLHGLGHWVTEDGKYILYVVHHHRVIDTVESFHYDADEGKLLHRGSYEHPLLRQLNDVLVVGTDEFYATVDHYFENKVIKIVEELIRLPFCSVVYYNHKTGEVKTAAGGLMYANGIAMSTNGRYIYVSSLGAGEVVAYTRNDDNTLKYVQAFRLQCAIDNIFIDPVNGHMWVAILPVPLRVDKYLHNQSYPVEGRILHIAVSEEEDLPFSSTKSITEEVFATDGRELGATTVGVYFNRQLLIGTILGDMMYCKDL